MSRLAVLAMGVALLAACARLVGDEFEPVVPDDLWPAMTADEAAAIARAHLDLKRTELVTPEQHRDADVHRVVLVRGSHAALAERRISPARIAAEPEGLVWIVFATGNFLNRSMYPWSEPGNPHRCGSIAVADDSGEVIGVFPHWDEVSGECP